MVRWFVEDEEIHGFKQQTNHCETRTFAARQHLNFLVRSLAAEHERAEDVADAGSYVAASHTVNGVKDSQFGVEQLCLVLCEIAYLSVMPHLKRSIEGYLAEYALYESGFALAVLSHERHLLASADGEVYVGDDGVIIAFAQVLDDKGEVAAALAGRELQVEG